MPSAPNVFPFQGRENIENFFRPLSFFFCLIFRQTFPFFLLISISQKQFHEKLMIFKKLLFTATKRKSQDSTGRPHTNKINFDPVSVAILSRHFSPLPSRIKSPTDLLDVIGYPQLSPHPPQDQLRHSSSPSLLLNATKNDITTTGVLESATTTTTPATATATATVTNATATPLLRHKRNKTQPSTFSTLRITNGDSMSLTEERDEGTDKFDRHNENMLLETTREDKTLIGRSDSHSYVVVKGKFQSIFSGTICITEIDCIDPITDINMELYKLYCKLLEIEDEREVWNQKLDQHMEELRSLLRAHQLEMDELKRQNSFKSATTDSASTSGTTHSSSDEMIYQTSSILPPCSCKQASSLERVSLSSLSASEQPSRSSIFTATSNKKKKKKKGRGRWSVVTPQNGDFCHYYQYYGNEGDKNCVTDSNGYYYYCDDDCLHNNSQTAYYNSISNVGSARRKIYSYPYVMYPSLAI
ncbi:hypothetical protein BDF20DRAFT_716565 [Mycotypha africana]|uniref:uncharacterized protein n=1 Tax=Mycotypha africana TaxID=64632 RepID=UPI00230053B7|nr:uncharacterized protein BDF20DRAFT_716565 [Mycotypha africana]KAI8972034.1 hypothetical protein BDF20DRAFT_716565 [Mycotypha africana]